MDSDSGSKVNTTSAVAVVNEGRVSDDTLRALTTMEDVAALFGSDVLDIADEGTGFAICENKDQLIGLPFVIIEFRRSDGDYGSFTSALVMTKNGDKFVVNDGSTGIHEQLSSLAARTGRNKGIVCKRGLRRSDYEYADTDGTMKPARTYYLDMSA